jgi:hypothetical protein
MNNDADKMTLLRFVTEVWYGTRTWELRTLILGALLNFQNVWYLETVPLIPLSPRL